MIKNGQTTLQGTEKTLDKITVLSYSGKKFKGRFK